MLGVRYFMAWTPEMQKLAAANPHLTLVKDIPQNPPIAGPAPDTELKDWKVYEVANSDLVVGMNHEPVVRHRRCRAVGRRTRQCWGHAWDRRPSAEPRMQDGWECTTAPWWVNRAELGTAYARVGSEATGSASTASDLAERAAACRHADAGDATSTTTVDTISFDVSEIGKPVEVKESYFPNWKVSRREGPVPARART